MAANAVACEPKRPRSVTPTTLLGWVQLAGSAVFLTFHAMRAWLTVIVGRLLGKHPLSHPEWPLDLAVVSAGFRVCMEKGCMVDFRPLLSGMSLLQFYPGLRLQKVQAGGCTAYWMTLSGGKQRQSPLESAQVVLFYVHGGAFVGGDARMTARTFQHWMQRLAASGITAAVLSVEYPLAPEHQFPAAVVDTAAAYSWLCQQLQQQGSSAVIMPVADSAGANILVAALTALRDISSGSSMASLVKEAAAQTAAVAPKSDQYHSADAAAEVEAAVVELFTSLSARLYAINSSSSSTSDADVLSRASSSNSSNGSNSSHSYQNGRSSSLATALSSSGSTTVSDMMVQIDGNADSTHAAGSAAAAAAAAGFVPPAAVVLVSPAMDISEQACFYDEEWRAKHEPRFDYLPISVVGGGMHHYVASEALLPCGYVSPLHAGSFEGLVGGPWLVLAGGAELMGRDIDSFVERLRCSVDPDAVVHHVEPHMPHSWAILPLPSMWPRQEVVVQFIAQQVAAHAKGEW